MQTRYTPLYSQKQLKQKERRRQAKVVIFAILILSLIIAMSTTVALLAEEKEPVTPDPFDGLSCTYVTRTVKYGYTLSHICSPYADYYPGSFEDFVEYTAAYNNISDKNLIYPGDEIVVPYWHPSELTVAVSTPVGVTE